MSDTTDDLWFLTEGESEQVSVEMKEAALEEGSRGEGEAPPEDDDGGGGGGGKEEKADREVRVGTKLDLNIGYFLVKLQQAMEEIISNILAFFDFPIFFLCLD